MNTIMVCVVAYLLVGALLTHWMATASNWFGDSPLPFWFLCLLGIVLWPAVIVLGLRELWRRLGPCGK